MTAGDVLLVVADPDDSPAAALRGGGRRPRRPLPLSHATQGMPGLAAQLGLLGAICVVFWRARRRPGAGALFAAWLAYQVTLQTSFSWPPAAAPAWLLLAVAVAIWRPEPRPQPPVRVHSARLATGLVTAAAILVAAPLPGLPVAADTQFRSALVASAGGQRAPALQDLATAGSWHLVRPSMPPRQATCCWTQIGRAPLARTPTPPPRASPTRKRCVSVTCGPASDAGWRRPSDCWPTRPHVRSYSTARCARGEASHVPNESTK